MSDAVPPAKSDLLTRTLSGLAMIAVAFAAFWLGGYFFLTFVTLIAVGVLWEWWGLSRRIAARRIDRIVWMIAGIVYVGLSCAMFAASYFMGEQALLPAVFAVLLVAATDIGAYFVGRTVGGPKLWPRISPNKTWSGLGGGMIASAGVTLLLAPSNPANGMLYLVFFGCVVAIVAQAGDLFESRMKRLAGVKDSGSLIPGHGGLFDRLDGLLAVQFAQALLMIFAPFLVHR
ncbi:phosphatidate cytidylyltransferase [Sphingomonas sp.]|uniref:phosphatidate cytidylyltransferase n=1 Tax=Sphingomonas sp. TaxID=28214 RepID=UPI0025F1858E|nr:phosphatidate cytidylyltransferase [Sphingomonas sp.]